MTPSKAHATRQGKLQLAKSVSLRNTEQLKMLKQLGVTHAITGAPFGGIGRDQYVAAAKKLRDGFAEAGFKISGVESDPVSCQNIKMGFPGREEEILNYIAAVEALNEAGIDMICGNFMVGIGWYRTNYLSPVARGGAMTGVFDYQESEKLPTLEHIFTEDQLWDNLKWFYERIIPVAEKSNVKIALHPDDPAISPLLGSARIITSADAYRRIMKMFPSPVNGVTFCQANFRAMGEDIYSVAREFCKQDKVFFIHYRDIEGTAATKFRETFHDNGPTDMPKMLEIYARAGFTGPIRPDEAPILVDEDGKMMAGEEGETTSDAVTTKFFAYGYMKGIMDTLNIAYE